MKARATRRGQATLGGIGALLAAALLFASLPLALLAFSATLAYAYLSWRFQEGVARLELVARRRVLEPLLYADRPANVELSVEGHNPAGLRVEVSDELPAGWQVVDGDAATRGQAGGLPPPARYSALPASRGSWVFTHARVRLADAYGLFQASGRLPCPQEVRVNADLESIRRGRAYARKKVFEPRKRSPFGLIFRDYEVDTIRDYQVGDRLRDIDWKASTRFQELMSKSLEKEMEGVVFCLVDASRSMRLKSPGTTLTRLDHASELVLQIGEVATSRNFQLGLVVFDESGILLEVPATRSKGLEKQLAEKILALPNSIAAPRLVDVGELGGPAEASNAFLAAVRTLRPAGGPRGVVPTVGGPQAAFQRLLATQAQGSVFAFVLSDLASAPNQISQGILRLKAKGHRVSLGLFAGSAHTKPPGAPTLRDLENAYRERALRRDVLVKLARSGVQVVPVEPGMTITELVEDAR